MPRVISTKEFYTGKRTANLMPIFKGEEDFVFVPNETYPHRSFIVVSLDFLRKLALKAGEVTIAETIDRLEKNVNDKLREKYTLISAKRKKHEI